MNELEVRTPGQAAEALINFERGSEQRSGAGTSEISRDRIGQGVTVVGSEYRKTLARGRGLWLG